jgi:hypothetical protein
MSVDLCTDESLSPKFSVIAESDLGSELSFESIGQGTQPTSYDSTTIIMSSSAQIEGLSFHPSYKLKDQMIVFQVSAM